MSNEFECLHMDLTPLHRNAIHYSCRSPAGAVRVRYPELTSPFSPSESGCRFSCGCYTWRRTQTTVKHLNARDNIWVRGASRFTEPRQRSRQAPRVAAQVTRRGEKNITARTGPPLPSPSEAFKQAPAAPRSKQDAPEGYVFMRLQNDI